MNKALDIIKKILLTLMLTLIVTGLNVLLYSFVDYRSLGMIYILAMNIYVLTFSSYNIFFGALLSSILWNFLFIPPRFTFHIDASEDWLMQLMFFTVAIIVGKLSLELKEKEKRLKAEYRKKDRFYNFFKFFNEIYSFKEAKGKVESFIVESLNFKVDVNIIFKNDKVLDSSNDNSLQPWQVYPLRVGENIDSFMEVRLKQNNDELIDEEISYLDFCAHQLSLDLERDALREANEKNKLLIESQKITNSLLSSVSHEFRTPLSTIKGFATSLVGNKSNNLNFSEIGTEIVEGVERLDNVVQNLLDMSRLESGYIKLKKEGIDPLDLVQSSIARTKSIFTKKEIRLSNELLEYEEIEGDYSILRQCLENILRNACIYAEGPIDVVLKKENGHIFFQVIDRGEGLKNPDLVFQKFYREKPEIPGGTGLGLSIVKSFIDLHQGEIKAYNRTDGNTGAIFELMFKPCKVQ